MAYFALFPARYVRTPVASGTLTVARPAFVPPRANAGPRLQTELLQNMLDVLLHSAVAAAENLANLAIAFSFSDPFHDFDLTFRQWRRHHGRSAL
jgi:hypothetical protein